MPTGQEWLHFFVFHLAWIGMVAVVFYYMQLSEIKKNWALYRCNPFYMPLADNIEQNFYQCIQTSQSHYMGFLTQPLEFMSKNMTGSLQSVTNDIQNVRLMLGKMRTFFADMVQSIMGVFLNLVLEFTQITIKMRDLVGKTMGVAVTLLYMMDGSVKTMGSTWKGPPGQMVRALGKCFSPSTLVEVWQQNGKDRVRVHRTMEDVKMGDILWDGSRVVATMRIDNTVDAEKVYEISTERQIVNVSGSHLVVDSETGQWVCVFQATQAKVAEDQTMPYWVCLITDSHRILIDNQVFWDWEDHAMKKTNQTSVHP